MVCHSKSLLQNKRNYFWITPGSTLECSDLTDFLLGSLITEIWEQVSLLDYPGRDSSHSYRSLLICQIVLNLKLTASYASTYLLTYSLLLKFLLYSVDACKKEKII